ncbi:MAG: LysM peptidoglycan-binding domain-containing protein [Alteromonadaceae bacterium]|nr:LysM peptidoglycan-binding domain-containing protein [Alteromonadaceae bacterium]
MKNLFPLAITCLFLFGCQSTLLTQESPPQAEIYHQGDHASVEEINQALLVDGAIPVMHPVADVDINLSDDSDESSNDIWQRIRSQFSFKIPQNRRVINQRNWYTSHQRYLDRVAKRSEPFIYYIVEELEKNNMPIELTLLPIVESAFDPFAYSHGRASGMWQFVPGTGKRFGMKQNWWYDGRRDVIASTKGAIKYLKYLHKYFNDDWLLALAAYNSGEGRVQRAVRKNKKKHLPIDFWSLNLPKETRAYVPKLLALADIIKRPADFNIKLFTIENKAVIEQVDIKSQLDLAKAAQLSQLSLAELQRLNPGFNRWATAPKGPHYLVLPKNKVERFKTKLDKLKTKDRLSWQRYKIKNGDSLSVIANKFHTSTELIRRLNNVKGNQIRTGKYLLIPVATVSLDHYVFSQNQRLVKKQSRQRTGYKIIHQVKAGDTFWDLGQTYKVSSRNIAKWNGMAPRDTLKLGQKLVIWQKPAKRSAKSGNTIEQAVVRNITYKVRRGDSFARIADKFNIHIRDIERWNKISRRNYLQPGQLLKLSVDVTNSI